MVRDFFALDRKKRSRLSEDMRRSIPPERPDAIHAGKTHAQREKGAGPFFGQVKDEKRSERFSRRGLTAYRSE